MTRKNPAALVPWLALFLVAAALWGQTTRGVVLGRVTDQSGAVVPAAQVVLVNQKTGISSQTRTTPEGDYAFVNVEPGTYRLEVTASGFKMRVTENLPVLVNQTVRMDVSLEVGDVSTKVEVEASAPVVQSDTSSVGNVVDSHQIVQMPLNGRQSYAGLLGLAPGVGVVPGVEPLMIAGGTMVGWTNITTDGSTDTDPAGRLRQSTLSIEAISEFKVLNSLAPAEFGHGGSQVVVATKSGTNEFHGSVLYFNRNRALGAKNFFATGLPKPKFNRNEFGGSLGGPIIRNRTFFFGDFEGLVFPRTQTNVFAMPTAALREGDFTGLTAIKDPLTGQAFPNNRIPPDRISGISKKLLEYASLPNGPGTGPAGTGNNFTVNVPGKETNYRYTARIDHQLTSKDTLMGRVYVINAGPYSRPTGSGTDKMGNYKGFGDTVRDVTISHTRVLSPRMLNELRFGAQWSLTYREPQNADLQPNTLIPGVMSLPKGAGGLPTVRITGFRGFSDVDPDLPNPYKNIEGGDNFSWTLSRHRLKAGFQFGWSHQEAFVTADNVRGAFSFDGRYTGNAFGDFLLGDLASSSRPNKPGSLGVQSPRYFSYIQDDWTPTPWLTLNIGLRHEFYGLSNNSVGTHDLANFDARLGKMVILAGQPDPRLLAVVPTVMGSEIGLDDRNWRDKDRTNFAPRFGFALRPLGTPRFVVRGGYGIFYMNNFPGWQIFGLYKNPPFIVQEAYEPAAGTVPSLTFANPFPQGEAKFATTGIFAFMLPRRTRTPYQQQWNFTLEYELMRNTSVRASYVGNKSTFLERDLDVNQPPQAPGPVQPRRYWQPFGTILFQEQGRNTIANQLQLSFLRRLSAGLQIQAEYQFSRALGESIHDGGNNDPINARLDRGNIDFYRRHFATVNYTYDLPFGKGKRFASSVSGAANKIISGWQFAGINYIRGGLPFSVRFSSNRQGWYSSRADVLPGVPLYPAHRSIAQWFDPAAFAVPQPFFWGNSAPNMLWGPGYVSWDLGLYKVTAITERLSIQVRAESFNLLNHANFGKPASNVSVPSTVGRISSAYDPRSIQFGARVMF